MLKFIGHFIDNIYINIAGLLALILSPFADAIGGNIFWWLFVILVSLFLFGVVDELKKNKKMKSATIHIPIVIKVDDGPDPKYIMNNLIEKIEEQNNLSSYEQTLKKYYSINLDTFIFEYKGSVYEFDRLMSFARIIKYKVVQIEKQLNGRVKFHLAYFKRPSVGFLLGSIFRTEALMIYQNSDFENRLYPVANINSRAYKEKIDKFLKYDISKKINNPNNPKVLIAIESASHNISIKHSNLIEFENIINIKLKYNGTIPYNIDWVEYATEIYNVLNDAQTQFSEITIAHAMPESISVTLGMALENYWNINITQFQNNQYLKVFNMKDIQFYS